MTAGDQLDLFPEPPKAAGWDPTPYFPDPANIRAKLLALLTLAREATEMPWDDRELLYHRTVFPQMANWLPADEAAQLRREFAAELARLEAV